MGLWNYAAKALFWCDTEAAQHDPVAHRLQDSRPGAGYVLLGNGAGVGEPTKLTYGNGIGYTFDGVDDRITGWPTVPVGYDVVAVFNGNVFWERGSAFLGLLATAGGVLGTLEFVAILPRLSQLQFADLVLRLRRRRAVRNWADAAADYLPLLYCHDKTTARTVTIQVQVPVGNSLEILWGDGAATTVVCNNVLNTYTHTYVPGTFQFGLVGDFDKIVDCRSFNQAWVRGDLAGFAALTSLQRLRLYSTGITGDIANLAGMPLEYLHLGNTGCTGDIANLSGMPLRYIHLDGNTGCTGDIANLAGMLLISLSIGSTGCTGDISNLAGMPLTILAAYNTGCTGDIANLAGMPLTVLAVSNTGCTGDIANLAGMLLTVLAVSNTGCTYPVGGMVQPLAWRICNIQCSNMLPTGWSTAMVDQMLLDHDAIAVAGYASNLWIAGTNAPHTDPGAPENARVSLVAKGKNVQVN